MNTAASKLRGLCCKPLAMSQTSTGAPATPRTQVKSKAQTSKLATRFTKRRVASSPSRSLVAASTGTKA